MLKNATSHRKAACPEPIPMAMTLKDGHGTLTGNATLELSVCDRTASDNLRAQESAAAATRPSTVENPTLSIALSS